MYKHFAVSKLFVLTFVRPYVLDILDSYLRLSNSSTASSSYVDNDKVVVDEVSVALLCLNSFGNK